MEFAWKDYGKSQKTSVMIVGVLVESRSEYLPSTLYKSILSFRLPVLLPTHKQQIDAMRNQ
jgi:hypothetical protein